MKVASDRSPFLKGINVMHIPMAHGEGNFVCRKEWILQGPGAIGPGRPPVRQRSAAGRRTASRRTRTARRATSPGVCDFTGRVLGLMPHPERHVLPTQHPRWTREGLKKEGDGLQLFRNAVEFFRQ